jgi:hypothetical protein
VTCLQLALLIFPLRNCEFLKKLDLTVNFVDLDELEESITHLQPRHHLKDLYLMGNPADSNWPNFKSYVIAKLPQLVNLDGTEITKSMRIIATQALPSLEVLQASASLPSSTSRLSLPPSSDRVASLGSSETSRKDRGERIEANNQSSCSSGAKEQIKEDLLSWRCGGRRGWQ